MTLLKLDAAQTAIVPSAASKLKEGAEFVNVAEKRTGAGRVALPSTRAPASKKGAKLWGGVLGQVKAKRTENAKELSTLDSLRRLEGLLVKLDEGDLATRVKRTPARELEHILGALNPIEVGMSEPFRRFEAGVAALEKQLMSRDTVAEDKLRAIRAAITRTLEQGHFGVLAPLEREPLLRPASATRAVAVGAEGASEAVRPSTPPPTSSSPAISLAPPQLTAEEEARRRQTEREGAEEVMSELLFGHYERVDQRELLLGGLHEWLDSAADELEDALEQIHQSANQHAPDADAHGSAAGGGPSAAFASKHEFDVELLIERGRSQFDALLDAVESGGTRARALHDSLASGLREQVDKLESKLTQMKVRVGARV